MSITTSKLAPQNSAAKMVFDCDITPGNGVTALVVRMWQVPFSFLVERVNVFCTAVAGTVTMLVGVVVPGRAVGAVTMVIATTTTKFKLSVALIAVMPLRSLLAQASGNVALPQVVNIAITDNIAFTTNFTINTAAAAGQFWGAARIQSDALGVITTKVSAADQVYATETPAINAVPAADPGFFDLGTISIRSAINVAFIANTTAQNAAGTTVNYNGKAAGFVNVCSADTVFVAANLVSGAMAATVAGRSVSQLGGLLVVQETTTGGATAADAQVEVFTRAWPLDGEVAGF